MAEYRHIVGYPNYAIYSIGVVKNIKTGRVLKTGADNKGYLTVRLYNNGKARTFKVRRLVAEYFIPNPLNKPQVNHKDGIKSNNDMSNLEWATNSENQLHAVENGLKASGSKWKENIGKGNKGKKRSSEHIRYMRNNNPKSKPVIQLDLDGNYINKYISTKDAERKTGCKSSNISMCCNGKIKTAKGFKWVYEEDYEIKS